MSARGERVQKQILEESIETWADIAAAVPLMMMMRINRGIL
jgi:hypothetical protein